ncbi:uncharacterized protein LOC110459067 [Mizuhopecten yessoensis]|uniref:uncharacterized protein LOC110459067 n=1 Tax=Mizuhopecten yessoensis TaxID=6573 RepID=UPI000B45D55A|nr:uncharacterized protein LOC110459067 [Mizuhopecten yessoensis]
MFQATIIVALTCLHLSLIFAVITPDPQCGSTKGCYPPTCPVGGCKDFHLRWEDAAEYIRFKMVASVPSTGNVWAAIGFSKDNQMKNSSVVMCKVDPTTVEIGYTDPLKNSYAALKTVSTLTNVSVARNGSYMTCTFARIKKPTEFPTQIFALNQTDLYLLNAHGPLIDGIPGYHNAIRQASASTLSFVNMTDTTPILPTTDAPPTSTQMATPSTTPANTATPLKITISSMFLTCLAVVVTLL